MNHKKLLWFLFSLVVTILLASQIQTSTVRANELFGDGVQYVLTFRSLSIGLIDGWGSYLIIEHMTSATTAQCLLLPITRTLADSQPVYCEKFYTNAVFRGFIYFRGHERPFCGGKHMPTSCLKLGDNHG